MRKFFLVATFLLSLSSQAMGKAIPFSDFRLLDRGMSEAEVLLRVGPPDRETVINNFFVYKKIWYYIPDGHYSGDYLTKLNFDIHDNVSSIERIKP